MVSRERAAPNAAGGARAEGPIVEMMPPTGGEKSSVTCSIGSTTLPAEGSLADLGPPTRLLFRGMAETSVRTKRACLVSTPNEVETDCMRNQSAPEIPIEYLVCQSLIPLCNQHWELRGGRKLSAPRLPLGGLAGGVLRRSF